MKSLLKVAVNLRKKHTLKAPDRRYILPSWLICHVGNAKWKPKLIYSEWKLKTPVVLIIFNRPDTTERVFAEIAKAKPSILLVVADGPRADRSDDVEKCAKTRAVVDRVDWDCKLYTNYSSVNLGSRNRVSSGLDWVFEQVEEAIILEDDCLPHPTFFRFCQELLERFRENDRIFMVSGRNGLGEWKSSKYSYFFSAGGTWGWATWRRAWQHFDVDLKLWSDEQAQKKMKAFFKGDAVAIKVIRKGCERVFSGKVDTWDYQWSFIRAVNHGMSVNPSVNLIANIGFGEDATHTKTYDTRFADVKVGAIEFPLKHNNNISLDLRYYRKIKMPSREKLQLRLKRYLKKLLRWVIVP